MTPQTLPEIAGETWLNTHPPRGEDLAGKVVMVNFWTFSSTRCQRDLRYLKGWWRDYRESGLVLLGIHTPEFDFERDPALVAAMVRELGVEWPVLLDNDHAMWDAFSNRERPVEYLANREGRIVYVRSGDGEFGKAEDNIRKLLRVAARQTAPSIMDTGEFAQGGACFVPTPDLHCGYEKGSIANADGFAHDRDADYLPPARLEEGRIALSGRFNAARQYVEAEQGAAVHVAFNATEVNLVLLPPAGEAVAAVRFGGEPMDEGLRGLDVGESGEVFVNRPAAYNLLSADEPVQGELSVEARRGRLQAYVFTFSGCVD